MKIMLKDLKKAVQWIEANSKEEFVRIDLAIDGRNLSIKCQDRQESQIEITLFNESTMNARIRKEDPL